MRNPVTEWSALFLSAHHIATQERAVTLFVEGAVRELQNRSCGIFLARDKAIAVEFEKQDADYEAVRLFPSRKEWLRTIPVV